jgi:hypothetical protein
MKVKTKILIIYIVNIILSIPILLILFISSCFTLATPYMLKDKVFNYPMKYLGEKLLGDFVIILISIFILWLLNLLLEYLFSIKISKIRIIMYQLLIYILLSMLFIIYSMIHIYNYVI